MSLPSKVRSATILLLAATAGLAPASAARDAEPKEAARVVAGVQGWLDATRTLRCRFVQRLDSGALGAGMEEGGRMLVQRPGKLRWDYEGREPKVAIIDGSATLLYLPDDRQMIRGALDPEASLLPSVLSGIGRLADLFHVALEPSGSSKEHRLRLRPRRAEGGVEEVVLIVAAKSFEIRGAETIDAAGNRSSFRFIDLRRNVAIEASAFEFRPPEGTRIVDQP